MSKKTCLQFVIVDDNPLDQTLILMALKRAHFDFEVKTFEDGEGALRYLTQCGAGQEPDLVILDCILPKVDGEEVLAQMRRSSVMASVPVILITALSILARPMDTEALQSQNVFCLNKPANLSELKVFEASLVLCCDEFAGLRNQRRYRRGA